MDILKFTQYLSRITHIPIVVCSPGGRIIEMFRDREEQMTLAELDADFFLQVLNNLKTDHMLLEEIQEQTYVGLAADEKGNAYVLGPVVLYNYYAIRIQEIRKQFQTPKEKLPLLTEMEHNDFIRVIMLLYEFLTGKEVTMQDVQIRSGNSEQLDSRVKKRIQQTFFERQENPTVHYTYQYEEQILECIRNGDMEHLAKKLDAPTGGQFGILANEETRASRNLGISMVTLFSRACISGGVIRKLHLLCATAIFVRWKRKTTGQVSGRSFARRQRIIPE